MKKIALFFAMLAIATVAMGQVKVLSNGNVGVGVSNPSMKLQVAGNSHFNGIVAVADGGYTMKLIPKNPTPEMQVNCPTLIFWETTVGWTQLNAKKFYVVSDSTLKENIVPLKNTSDILKKLKTYSYYYKSDDITTRQKEYGVLAQEVEAVLPELVTAAKGNKLINYDGFIPFLINGFNEQQSVIEKQQMEIEMLQKAIFSQEKELVELKEIVFQYCANPKSLQTPVIQEEPQQPAQEKAVLYQNTPNPFTSNTEISCNISEINNNAFIFVYNLQGMELKSFPITQTGFSTVVLYASELPAGMYLYTLVVDNQIIDTKRMILTK